MCLSAVFTKGVNGDWIDFQELTASDAAPATNFGASVAMSGDTLVVGACQGWR
jgi:FG-GAP repeat